MQRRNFLIGFLGVGAGLVSSNLRSQPAPHWLIGTWIGEVKLQQDKNPTGRRMVILSVTGDDVALRYGFPDTDKPPLVHGTLRGSELRFSAPGVKIGDNPIILSRSGDNGLAGTWSSARTGKTYPIEFKRQ